MKIGTNLVAFCAIAGSASAFTQPLNKAASAATTTTELEAFNYASRSWNGVETNNRNSGAYRGNYGQYSYARGGNSQYSRGRNSQYSSYGSNNQWWDGNDSYDRRMNNRHSRSTYNANGGYQTMGNNGNNGYNSYGNNYGHNGGNFQHNNGYGNGYQRQGEYSPSYGYERRDYSHGGRQGYGYTQEGSAYIDGHSTRTLVSPPGAEAANVFLTSEGRPIEAELEFYSGPNSPARMKIYSEDGYYMPFQAAIATPGYESRSVSIRNVGQSLPIEASVTPGRDPRNNYSVNGDISGMQIQGKSLKTWSMNPTVGSARVVLQSSGMPIMATVEIWGVSDHVSQTVEIYCEDGNQRPLELILELPDEAATVAIRNKGEISFPLDATVEAHSSIRHGEYAY